MLFGRKGVQLVTENSGGVASGDRHRPLFIPATSWSARSVETISLTGDFSPRPEPETPCARRRSPPAGTSWSFSGGLPAASCSAGVVRWTTPSPEPPLFQESQCTLRRYRQLVAATTSGAAAAAPDGHRRRPPLFQAKSAAASRQPPGNAAVGDQAPFSGAGSWSYGSCTVSRRRRVEVGAAAVITGTHRIDYPRRHRTSVTIPAAKSSAPSTSTTLAVVPRDLLIAGATIIAKAGGPSPCLATRTGDEGGAYWRADIAAPDQTSTP